MRTVLIVAAALLLAACGPGNNQAAEPKTKHDHYHSHGGETTELGSRTVGEVKFSLWRKGTVERGGTTIVEVKVEGTTVTADKLFGTVLNPAGEKISVAAFHAMAETGRFGGHVGVPQDAPKRVILRLHVHDTTGPGADFPLE